MESRYAPSDVERRWQEAWEAEGLYAAGAGARRDDTYVICVPPPNVTGDLHIGHAVNGSIQDVLVRWHRMRGFDTLWQPGYDHAGIATQNVVEKELAKEGLTRHDLGREAFVERTWEWLEKTGRTIMGQFRRLGASLDYSRERFTMDDEYVRAVMTFFVRLWERGWIYRANRIVNWCPFHSTAISDLEVVHEEMDDTLYTIRYPFADGDGRDGVSVATVRPATILADVAVAVHPDDPRYRDAVGREVIVPYTELRVPVIADARIDREFGTGALKVTPGHDPLDFDIGRDHGLPEPMAVRWDGLMSDEAGDLAGRTQEEAGERVLAWADERGLVEKREPYRHSVGTCERCHSRIEPLISLQWWCAMAEPAAPAIEALQERRVRYHPESQHRFAIASLEETPDWCISRQLWWGHQLPIWTCPDGHPTVQVDEPSSCAECGSAELVRETDVLDTWFSSALWPYATLGWPDDTPELARYYPGNVSSTAREIIRLWENRMIWTGLEARNEVPFTDVIIHSTILALDGRRMSKSLGTGIDPMEPIEEYGADATRYGLLKISSTQDVRFSYGAIEEGRKLAIKLWNVARLVLQSAEDVTPSLQPRDLEERWILARIDAARTEVEDAWGRFDFSEATATLYHLVFDDFCDWYAEAIKPRLYERDEAAIATALAALERLLALLHPVMPHVTEEIWTQLPDRQARLIVSPWPEPDDTHAADAGALERVQEAAQIFRRSNVQVELGSDDERRIFAAVVRPERAQGEGDRATEMERLRKEVARAEGMLANERFVANAPAAVVDAEREKLERYRGELAALEDAS
jgi:valyl-tRNA synthetase